MRKKRFDKDIVLLLITTVITLASWIGFEVYHAYIKIDPVTGAERHLTPINAKLNIQVLEKLSKMDL